MKLLLLLSCLLVVVFSERGGFSTRCTGGCVRSASYWCSQETWPQMTGPTCPFQKNSTICDLPLVDLLCNSSRDGHILGEYLAACLNRANGACVTTTIFASMQNVYTSYLSKPKCAKGADSLAKSIPIYYRNSISKFNQGSNYGPCSCDDPDCTRP